MRTGFSPAFFAAPAFLVLALVLVLAGCSNSPSQKQDLNAGSQSPPTAPVKEPEGDEGKIGPAVDVSPTQFPLRQKYFEEAFRPKRETYRLFEKAANYLKIPVGKVPEYFSLNSESEIFADLAPVPKDFSEVAFLLASGRYYSIGQLSEEYFTQPEFYPNFKQSGMRPWAEPDPKYWGTNGYGTYPAEQWDTLSISGRKEFTTVVFFYTGYGIQTYQGATLAPTAETLERFDVSISPDTFLLTPTFPKFTNDWAHQIIIKGKLREGVPEGKYLAAFKVVEPPKEKKEEWEFKYRNVYFDAATSIAPADYPIKFNITVTG